MKAFALKLFPVTVYLIKDTGWENYKDYLLTSIKDQKDPAYWERDGFYTDYGKEQPWRETIWNEFMEPQVSSLLKDSNTKLQDIWCQQYINQAGFTAHQHQTVGFSCVLYAQFDPEVHWGTSMFRPYLDPNDLTNSGSVTTPEVEEGNIVVFPSWLLHQVTPSDTEKPRTIVAFNLIPK